jgi:hypothetical protein
MANIRNTAEEEAQRLFAAPDAKPCPFCENRELVLVSGEREWFVWCRRCDCNGPSGPNKPKALILWNEAPRRRTPSQKA